jgi:hypothetical protein
MGLGGNEGGECPCGWPCGLKLSPRLKGGEYCGAFACEVPEGGIRPGGAGNGGGYG